ncbi:MAG: SUMF1/EgtB/PvdO family nonheme iron enzyme, partial [bacterium]|nr:SUMF1/EgtB/PvdO family nonheme iron enzyme [bacterium]
EERREAGLTAVTTYPKGVSLAGVWDACGNVWEWTGDIRPDGGVWLRGGSWANDQSSARVSFRDLIQPVDFYNSFGFRVLVAPVF